MPNKSSVVETERNHEARKRRELIIVVVVAVALILQGLYSFSTRPEPYPTVRMPGFGDAPKSSGKFANNGVEISVVLANGAVLHPSPDELAGDVRYSSARPTLDYVFRPKANGERNPKADDPEVIAWLSSRVAELSPVPAREVLFCWRKRVVDISDASAELVGPCESENVAL